LPLPRCLDPLSDRSRALPQPVAAQLLVVHVRDLNPVKTTQDNV
jgi:hypothetical protein